MNHNIQSRLEHAHKGLNLACIVSKAAKPLTQWANNKQTRVEHACVVFKPQYLWPQPL